MNLLRVMLEYLKHFFAAKEMAKITTPPAAQKTKGLEAKWIVGEILPWKGIRFVVQVVNKDSLVLVPKSMTSNMAKTIEEAKNK